MRASRWQAASAALANALKMRLDHMVRFVAVKQFEVQVAARLVGEALEEFPRQTEAKGAGHVLVFFGAADFPVRKLVQSPPDQIRAPAEIHDAAGEAFVHGHIGFAGERIARIEPAP